MPLQKTCPSTVILCTFCIEPFFSKLVGFPFPRLNASPCPITRSSLLSATARAQLPPEHFLQAPVGFEGFLPVSHSCVGTLSQHTCKCYLSTSFRPSCTHVWHSCYTPDSVLCTRDPESSWPGPHQVYSLYCQENSLEQDQKKKKKTPVFPLDITPHLSVTSKNFFLTEQLSNTLHKPEVDLRVWTFSEASLRNTQWRLKRNTNPERKEMKNGFLKLLFKHFDYDLK